jgi:hypothetical protein
MDADTLYIVKVVETTWRILFPNTEKMSVLYSGYDQREARRVYQVSKVTDFCRGQRTRETVMTAEDIYGSKYVYDDDGEDGAGFYLCDVNSLL